MPDKPLTTNYPVIKSVTTGTALPAATMRSLLELEVEKTYNRPDMCLLRFDLDPKAELPPTLDLGKEIEVAFKEESTPTTIFKGEVTALEVDAIGKRTTFTVQAEDKLHRLFKNDETRTFVNKTLSDMIKQVAGDHGIGTGQVKATTTKYEFMMQQNVSNGAFLQQHVPQHNMHFRMSDDGSSLVVTDVGSGGDSGVEVRNGSSLLSFSARITGGAFLKEAQVRSWDVQNKKEIISKATSFTAEKDSKVASAAINAASPVATLVRTGAPAAADATDIAKSVMERSNEHNRQAEGTCHGKAKLAVDKLITISGVNARFNGKYRLSRVRHRYSHEMGYQTDFASLGASDMSITALVEEAAGSMNRAADRDVFDGVAIGIVSDIDDPLDLGRVKVSLPTLADQVATDWMRVSFPGGGGEKHHGWYLLPDVGDEVLVAFEQGDARRGYVLGGLLNGKDKPFYKKADVIKSGKVNQHAFRCNNGTHLLFDEKNGGDEIIELKNKDGKFVFKLDTAKGVELTNKTSGKVIKVNADGDISILSDTGNISIEAKAGGITMKAAKDISIESSGGKVSVKAAQDASMEGMNAKVNGQVGAEVKGGATAKLEASGQTTVKGAMVMIN